MVTPRKTAVDPRVVGWREWLALPEFGISRIKAKIDTGARTSSLHAFDLVSFLHRGHQWVRFEIHPMQRTAYNAVLIETEVLEYRKVRSSNGHASVRPVIATQVQLMGQEFPIEITLANRDEMGFRMLLGREAIRGRFLVDVGRSFQGLKLGRKSEHRSRGDRRASS
jgi:hypothetical protein